MAVDVDVVAPLHQAVSWLLMWIWRPLWLMGCLLQQREGPRLQCPELAALWTHPL